MIPKENYLRAVLSSRRLLQQAPQIDHVLADGTYKLNVHGIPVILVGTTDKTDIFTLFALLFVHMKSRVTIFDWKFFPINILIHIIVFNFVNIWKSTVYSKILTIWKKMNHI